MDEGQKASEEQAGGANISTLTLNMAALPSGDTSLSVPTIYADMIRGAFVAPETTRFNLMELKMDLLGDDLKAMPVASVVMPTSQLRAWGEFFVRMADQHAIPATDVE